MPGAMDGMHQYGPGSMTMAQRSLLQCDDLMTRGPVVRSGAPVGRDVLSNVSSIEKRGKPPVSSAKPDGKAAAPSNEKTETIICQVCAKEVPSNSIRKYIRVRKVCNGCRTSECVVKNGKKMRFCQLCSWFHPVDNFEGKRHSCKNALEKHNQRRRQKTVKSKGQEDGQDDM